MRTRRAFSLVELLVVVAIIALLAAMVLPGLARAREYAYFTSCKSSQRQIGIACLLYAGSNRGRIPVIRNWCTDTPGAHGGYTCFIGGGAANWIAGLYWDGDMRGRWLLWKLHSDATTGQYWDGTSAGTAMYGAPGEAGSYLPVEAFWDPIVKVRGWGPWGNWAGKPQLTGKRGSAESTVTLYADDEWSRDALTRSSSNTCLGYDFFVQTVNCRRFKLERWLGHQAWDYWGPGIGMNNNNDAEGSNYRNATKNRNVSAAHRPSTWIAACLTPVESYQGVARNMPSHFGWRTTVTEGWRFNVIHLDGHVDDSTWKLWWTGPTSEWMWTEPEARNKKTPYGWKHDRANYAYPYPALKEEPEYDGAFDRNL